MKHTAPTFFDLENQFAKIYQINNFLPKLKQIIPWEIFRPTLKQIRNKERLSNAGCKPFDVILMFKIIVLQTVYKLSIEQTELQIRDRLSFRDFLDLTFAVPVPDAKTIWLFAEHPKMASHKDTGATYTYKNDEKHYGYKNHVSIDDEHKFIRSYSVTTAKAHELSVYLDLVPDVSSYADQEFIGRFCRLGRKVSRRLTKRGFTSWVHERGCGQKKLTEEQRSMNKVKSGVRCRVEHVFGAMWVHCRNDMLQKMDGVELFFGSVCVTWRTTWSVR